LDPVFTNPLTSDPSRRGRLSTDDLLVLTSLDQLLFMYETYLNEEVNCTEPFYFIEDSLQKSTLVKA
jgi:hypothetical protein